MRCKWCSLHISQTELTDRYIDGDGVTYCVDSQNFHKPKEYENA
jgi:hypothetical protein